MDPEDWKSMRDILVRSRVIQLTLWVLWGVVEGIRSPGLYSSL